MKIGKIVIAAMFLLVFVVPNAKAQEAVKFDPSIITDPIQRKLVIEGLAPVSNEDYEKTKNSGKDYNLTPVMPDANGPVRPENLENYQDFYKFGKISVEVNTEKNKYSEEDVVKVLGSVINSNEYPVFENEIYVQIFREESQEENKHKNGDHLIDQFFLNEKFNLDKDERKSVSFEWKVPRGVETGGYKMAFSVIVERKYNMSGLTFSNNIYAGTTFFQIESGSNKGVFIDRNNVKFNGELKNQRAYIPIIKENQTAKYEIPIVNPGDKDKNVILKQSLFFWDGVGSNHLINQKEENVSIAPGKTYNFSYEQVEINEPVYFLVLEAVDGESKSILNLRFGTDKNPRGRINYSGLTKFPLRENEETTLFTTFHSVSDQVVPDGQVEVMLKDRSGNVLEAIAYKGEIRPDIKIEKKIFKLSENIDYATLTSIVKDGSGKVTDEGVIVLDASHLASYKMAESKVLPTSNPLPEGLTGKSFVIKLAIAVVSLALVVSFIIIFIFKKIGPGSGGIFSVILLISISFFNFWLFQDEGYAEKVQAAKDAWTESGNGKISITKGWGKWGSWHDSGARWLHTDLNVNYTFNLGTGINNYAIESTNNVDNGTSISFNPSNGGNLIKDGEWYTPGSWFDTPPVIWRANDSTFSFDKTLANSMPDFANVAGCNSTYQTMYLPNYNIDACPWDNFNYWNTAIYSYDPVVIENPVVTLTGGGSVTCVGNSCTASGTGPGTVTVTVASARMKQAQANYPFRTIRTSRGICWTGCNYNLRGNGSVYQAIDGGYSDSWLYDDDGSVTNYSLTLPSYTRVYNFNVITPECTGSITGNSTICSGDDSGLSANVERTLVSSCTPATKCEYTCNGGFTKVGSMCLAPISGSGGIASESTYCEKPPTEDLCSVGTPSDVTFNVATNYWEWTCQGLYGGSDTACQALKSCAWKEVNPE